MAEGQYLWSSSRGHRDVRLKQINYMTEVGDRSQECRSMTIGQRQLKYKYSRGNT